MTKIQLFAIATIILLLVMAVAITAPWLRKVGIASISEQARVSGPQEPVYHLVRDKNVPASEVQAELAKKPHLATTYRWVGDSLLNLAAMDGRVEVAKVLVAMGADVNGNDNGAPPTAITPLCTAVVYGRTDIIEYLLSVGADPYHRGGMGEMWGMSAIDASEQAPLDVRKLFDAYRKPLPGEGRQNGIE